MDYMTLKETKIWGISILVMYYYCTAGISKRNKRQIFAVFTHVKCLSFL